MPGGLQEPGLSPVSFASLEENTSAIPKPSLELQFKTFVETYFILRVHFFPLSFNISKCEKVSDLLAARSRNQVCVFEWNALTRNPSFSFPTTSMYLFSKVVPSSPVLVVSGHRDSPLTPGLAVYPVTVVNFTSLRQSAAPVFINVSCVLTGQSEAVLVRGARDPGAGEHWGLFLIQRRKERISSLVGNTQPLDRGY